MSRKLAKRELRRLAAMAKQRQGYSIEDVGGRGIAPGARLQAKKGLFKTSIAVRTSHDRKVGLTRTETGKWRTVLKVEEVLVAAISRDNPNMVEVLCFKRSVLVRAFNRRVASDDELRRPRNGKYSPVFIELDSNWKDEKCIRSNLKKKAEWSRLLPLTLDTSGSASRMTVSEVIDRAKRDYAVITGVDLADVVVEIRLIGSGEKRR